VPEEEEEGRGSEGLPWNLQKSQGPRERAREEELGRWSGWGRRVDAKAAGGGVGKELEWR
jgi:hypothetical protein